LVVRLRGQDSKNVVFTELWFRYPGLMRGFTCHLDSRIIVTMKS